MKRLLKKPFSWAILFSVILIGTSTFVLLDTFVIPKSYTKAVSNNTAVLSSNSKDVTSISSIKDISDTENKPIEATATPSASVNETSASVTPIQGEKIIGKSKSKTKKKGSSNTKKPITKKNTESITEASNTEASNSKASNTNTTIKNNLSKNKEISKSSKTSVKTTIKTKTSIVTSAPKEDSKTIAPKDIMTDTQYKDNNIEINIDTIRQYDTSVHIADIKISNISYLKAALANDTYGRNIKLTTSDIAASHNAILAVNGDFYGFRNYGYVLRNGTLYRDTAGNSEDLVINNKGNFSSVNESKTSVNDLDLKSIWQIFSFGPMLISSGELKVNEKSEVVQSMASNPRTAIGMITPLHYLFIVSDGRTRDNKGLSLFELATIMNNKGCTSAYNLDGGGSSTMVFNGKVINNPTDGYNHTERKVSDILYIGY